MSPNTPLEIQFPLRPKPRLSAHAAKAATQPNKGRLPRITQVLALAIYFDHMIQGGDAKDYADIARWTCLCRERVSQIMRLNYLAPDIQIELLYLPPTPSGHYPVSETALRKIANLLSWAEQRSEWTCLKRRQNLI